MRHYVVRTPDDGPMDEDFARMVFRRSELHNGVIYGAVVRDAKEEANHAAITGKAGWTIYAAEVLA